MLCMHEKQSLHRYREGEGADLGSAARIVDGAGAEDPALATYQERSVIVRDIGTKRRRTQIPEHHHEQLQQQ